MRRTWVLSLLGIAVATSACLGQANRPPQCGPDNAGLKLPAGFCATIFADSVPGARHMAVAPNGDVFLSMQGRGGGIMALRDADHDGRAEIKQRFASGYTTSEVRLFDGHLYTEAYPQQTGGGRGNTAPPPPIAILRYPLKPGELMPSGPPDTIVQDLPSMPEHFTRNFVITPAGVMYLNIGSPSNSCQEKDRGKESPGKNPCPDVEVRAGIWKFDARAQHQTATASNHFARGIRNAVGMALDPADGKLWTTQHGRDQLGGPQGDWSFDAKYNAENPAEELMQVSQGDDFGWPYCYFAVEEHHLVLAPEYGGDGKKVEQCAQKHEPVASFPGHWAPNGLMFYTGSNVSIAIQEWRVHRVPWVVESRAGAASGVQRGVSTVAGRKGGGPVSKCLPTGSTRHGVHRPTGLAQGTDGALYVADDTGGRIYRIIYVGK